MNKLIGKLIKEVFISSCGYYLRFVTDQGDIYYNTENDCCNLVWIEHINGVERLLGNKVKSVDEIPYRDASIDERSLYKTERGFEPDALDVFGYKLKMEPYGYVDIECRNDHNGYYSGSLVESNENVIKHMLRPEVCWNPVTEDF